MSWFLRKVRWNRWQERIEDPQLPFAEMSPDPIGDIPTSGRKLSLWQLDASRSNLNRVVALLAATVQAPAECSFIIFPAKTIEELGLEAVQNQGNSPDVAANLRWHYDLNVVSAIHLLELARYLLSRGELERRNAKEVIELLQTGVARNELDPTKMLPQLREKLKL